MLSNSATSAASLQINQQHRNRNENDSSNVVKLASADSFYNDNKAGVSKFNHSGQHQQQRRTEHQPRTNSQSQDIDLYTATASVSSAWPTKQGTTSILSVFSNQLMQQQPVSVNNVNPQLVQEYLQTSMNRSSAATAQILPTVLEARGYGNLNSVKFPNQFLNL